MTSPSEGITMQGDSRRTGSAGTPRELLAQFASLLQQNDGGGVQRRLEELQEKVESLALRLDTAPASLREGSSGGPSAAISEELIGQKLKKLLTGILFESGILERIVSAAVEKQLKGLDLSGGAGGGADALKKESVRLVKEFLSQNLAGLFQKEIRAAVASEMQSFMAGEEMKVLIDDKFRAIQLYLTTEVVPNNVKQILRNLSQRRA
ncbi:MAG: hypothetical protein JXA90_10750 [Planctomycetes bacterium]|nr:hypothetical protein [Planctomycetota bacterium]